MATVGASGSAAGAGRPGRRRSARKATRSFAARMRPLRQDGAARHCGAGAEAPPGSAAARALRPYWAWTGRGGDVGVGGGWWQDTAVGGDGVAVRPWTLIVLDRSVVLAWAIRKRLQPF